MIVQEIADHSSALHPPCIASHGSLSAPAPYTCSSVCLRVPCCPRWNSHFFLHHTFTKRVALLCCSPIIPPFHCHRAPYSLSDPPRLRCSQAEKHADPWLPARPRYVAICWLSDSCMSVLLSSHAHSTTLLSPPFHRAQAPRCCSLLRVKPLPALRTS